MDVFSVVTSKKSFRYGANGGNPKADDPTVMIALNPSMASLISSLIVVARIEFSDNIQKIVSRSIFQPMVKYLTNKLNFKRFLRLISEINVDYSFIGVRNISTVYNKSGLFKWCTLEVFVMFIACKDYYQVENQIKIVFISGN